ncbi:hypothetical protein O181_050829, partial [Austropuccinia psidii MF-1]|nr:hypothetical protein [Austropuccinia psidii MF-1]
IPYVEIKTSACLVGMHQDWLSFGIISEHSEIPLKTFYNAFCRYEQIGTVKTQKK